MSMQAAGIETAAHRVGQLVSGRYRITALLGEGGMGAVYVAEHILMRKRFALKLLHPEMAQNEEVLARFRREAEAAAHLEHPHVVAATDFGQMEDGAFFLVLELVEGVSLRDALRDAPFPPERALRVAVQISRALDRAHEAGIVHRDLKPENVMLVRKGDDGDFVKVLDFGVARFERQADRGGATQPLTQLGTVMGTPEYMAPEQALGERATACADLYALGVVLYEMLTARHPFDGDTMAMLSMHIVAPVPAMADRAPHVSVPAAVENVVRRLLEKDAKARYPSARALLDAIAEAALASGIDLGLGPQSSDRMSVVAASPSSDRMSVVVTPAHTAAPATTSREVFAQTAVAMPAVTAPARRSVTGEGHLRRVLEAVLAIATGPRARAAIAGLRVQANAKLDRMQAATKLPRRTLVVMLVSVTALVVGFAIIAGVLIVRQTSPGSSGGVAATVSQSSAPPAKLRAAATKGPAALEGLAEEFPGDTAVLRELAFAYDAAGRSAEALAAVRRLVDAGPAEMPRDVVRVVMRAASKFDTADRAFELLEERLGPDGVDALLELSDSKDVPERTRARASSSIRKPHVVAQATPAAALIIELGAASTCEARRDVLLRSGEHADARALPALRALKSTRGCGRRGKHDCHRCLRGDGTLDHAIALAEAREGR